MITFVDTYRKGDITLKKLTGLKDSEKLKVELKVLIKREPFFFKPYVLLYELLEGEGKITEAKEVLDKGYERLKQLFALPSGRLPDRVPWEYESNLHILEFLTNYGIFLWEMGDIENSLEVLKLTYNLDPTDKEGVRYYILAIKMGMGLDEFERAFSVEGVYDTKDLESWFNSHREVFEKEISAL